MKAKILSLLLFLAVISVACSDWLDVTSSNEIKSEDQFEKESGFMDALTGVYIGMGSEALYSKMNTWYFMDLLGQQYHDFENNITSGIIASYNYKHAAASECIESMWNGAYSVIANINHVLKYIDDKKEVLHPVNYSLIKGELLGLRAYLHFDLMRQFGYGAWQGRTDLTTRKTIPYVREFAKDITPQLSYAETFKLLESDMEAAAAYLKEDPVTGLHPKDYYKEVNADGYWNNRQMRMNYYAVKALQARAYMWEGSAGSKSKALKAAEEVIGCDMYKWIASDVLHNTDVAQQDLTFTTEYLFGLYITDFSKSIAKLFDMPTSTNYNSQFYLTPGMVNTIYEISTDWIYDEETDDWIEVTAGPGLSDYRYTKLLNIGGNDNQYCVPIKLRQVDKYADAYRNRMPLVKIAEMFYIAAECYVIGETPDLALARERLNTVRGHRGIATKLDDALTAEELEDEIYKEYRKEYVCEGQMFYYYKRLGKTEILKDMDANPVKMTDDKYMLPYPVEEIAVGNRVQ